MPAHQPADRPAGGEGAGGDARATMRDIAALAGVSRTTVSHALSGQGRVNPDTRERVRSIAADLGFVPSPTALALKTGRTQVVALVNATTGGSLEYYMLAANTASGVALESGYALALVPNEGQETWVSRLAMDGAIVLDPLDDDPIMRALHRRGTPVVTIGGPPDADDGREPTIRTDRTTSTREVLDHLWSRGARRPALLIDRHRRRWILETREAYRRWMHDRGLTPVVVDVPATTDERAGYQAGRRLLDHTGVDAAYLPFAPLAGGVLAALGDAGVDVPGDVRLVVQEGVHARTAGLTALDDRPDEVARLATCALLRRLADPALRPEGQTVALRLIPRQST